MTPVSVSDSAQQRTLDLAKTLIACRSITPDDGGALTIVAERLGQAGFECERIDRGGVRNLWARFGRSGPLVCLAGHVDVVPPGAIDQWHGDPFVAIERDGALVGRGAADMKASVAALVTAAERIAASSPGRGSIAVLLTSDEEGDARHGTRAVVEALQARGVAIDAAIVGEPTCVERFGDTIKNGRRGSLNGILTVHGVQCHIAYPERGLNPIHAALPALTELAATRWDEGSESFPPTGFQISNVRAGAGANNVIPATLEVMFNFRFSPASTVDALKERTRRVLEGHGVRHSIEWSVSAEPFGSSAAGPLVTSMRAAVTEVTGQAPALSTSGGTSDGRFLAAIAQEVVEFGPLNGSIHQVNEHVRIADLGPLSLIYERAVRALFA